MESSRCLSRCRKRSSGSGSRSLSEELIREILSWACVTSLLRCRSVCKLWLSIISEPEFLEAQHMNSQINIPSILMITLRVDGGDENEQGRRRRDYGRRLAATIVYPNSPPEYSVNLPLMPPFDNVNFVSSCYGIVCVSDTFHRYDSFRGEIYLFNPLNMMYKKLPSSIVYAAAEDQQQHLLSSFDVVFGFDSLSSDSKVLKIAYQRINGKLVKLQAAQLYSNNSNLWREIEVGIELPSLFFYPACPNLISGPVVNGILYLEAVNTIITFDLHNELFGLIPYPSFMHTRKSSVLEFEGSVAVALLDEKGVVSLWTVESSVSDDEVFWNKILTFDAGSEEIDWVFVYCGAHKFVGNTRFGTLVLYDYRKKETKHIILPSQSFLVKLLKHTESFISVKGFEPMTDEFNTNCY